MSSHTVRTNQEAINSESQKLAAFGILKSSANIVLSLLASVIYKLFSVARSTSEIKKLR